MSLKDLGTATLLGADAVGRPGQRRFRLFARTRAYSAVMWMEKEQLLNLSLVIDRILAQISEGRILRTEAQVGAQPAGGGEMPGDFPASPDYDLQVGQLRLSFEGDREVFILVAVPFEITEDEQGEPQIELHADEGLSVHFTIEQAQSLTGRITALVSAGRPVCPLCHAPLDGGPHACVKQNGHREIVQMLEGEEDDEEEEE